MLHVISTTKLLKMALPCNNCMPSNNEDQNEELTPVQHDVEMLDFQDPEEAFSKHSVQHIANYSE